MGMDDPQPSVIVDGPAEGVRTLVMNEPDTRNALTASLVSALRVEFDAAKADRDTRCVVITSSHPTVFCAGGDLAAFTSDTSLMDRHHGVDGVVELFGQIENLGKPVLAAVNGRALAGGVGLVLSCDLVLARADAEFGCPEITIGTFPFMVSAMLVRAVGKLKANEILMMGEPLSSHGAEAIGLVNAVFEADEFADGIVAWARRLSQRSPLILGMGKDALIASRDMSMPDALAYLQSQLTLAFSTEDLDEGVAAFFEHRQPVWKGR